jgi:hypothetical protein
MCDRARPRFLCMYHREVMNDPDNVPLDAWMEANIPQEYRVVSVIMDKIINDEITFVYSIVMELI